MITRSLSKVALVLLLASSPAYAVEAIYGVWVPAGMKMKSWGSTIATVSFAPRKPCFPQTARQRS